MTIKKVEITLRIGKKSKYSSLPVQIWFGIIHFLKPRLCLEIKDQGTIYGSYVKIDGLSVVNLLINTYILLSDSRGDLFNFFKSDFMYSQTVNNFEMEKSYIIRISSMEIWKKLIQCQLFK